jgi:hypothetical protein
MAEVLGSNFETNETLSLHVQYREANQQHRRSTRMFNSVEGAPADRASSALDRMQYRAAPCLGSPHTPLCTAAALATPVAANIGIAEHMDALRGAHTIKPRLQPLVERDVRRHRRALSQPWTELNSAIRESEEPEPFRPLAFLGDVDSRPFPQPCRKPEAGVDVIKGRAIWRDDHPPKHGSRFVGEQIPATSGTLPGFIASR